MSFDRWTHKEEVVHIYSGILLTRRKEWVSFAATWMDVQLSSVQSHSHVWLFMTPWTTAHQASLSVTNSRGLLKFMSVKSVMPSKHLILHRPLLLLPLIFPSIRVFSKESAFCIRWPKYWNLSLSISPSSEYSGLISFRSTCLISLLSKELSRVFSNTAVQKHQYFSAQTYL